MSVVWEATLARVDTHVIRPHEYDEIPELSDTDFGRGIVHEGGLPVRRGRPKLGAPKQQVTLRLDRDVVEQFRATGKGWQSRINAALRKSLERA